MGVRVGGRVGPVSASAPAGGCLQVTVVMLVIFAALGALAEYWKYALAIVVAALIGVAVWGRWPRKPRGQHFGAAGPDDAAVIAELNTRPASVRAMLREKTRTGELPSIPGYHWTAGDMQESDAESPAKYSDRR